MTPPPYYFVYPKKGYDGLTLGSRGIACGGRTLASNVGVKDIEYFDIVSDSSSTDFGELDTARYGVGGGISSATRGIFTSGYSAAYKKASDYITIASAGTATNFGNPANLRYGTSGCSNSTRGVIFSGANTSGTTQTTIECCTIATTSSWTSFGNIDGATGAGLSGAAASSTRGVWYNSSTGKYEYVTIATTANASEFESVYTAQSLKNTAASSGTRAVWCSGGTSAAEMEYITIATLAAGQDFGDMQTSNTYRNRCAGANTTIKAIFCAGLDATGVVSEGSYITIATAGNASTWGDIMDQDVYAGNGCSNGHGGLA